MNDLDGSMGADITNAVLRNRVPSSAGYVELLVSSRQLRECRAEDEANEWIGPHLGLPPLPYIDWPAIHGSAPDGTLRKTQYVVEYAAGRPFAWVDDEMTERDRAWIDRQGPGRSLLLRIDPRIGLERADFDALARWAADRDEN
ncbi:hypothetical protein [Streptomyces atratus]|uniref:hypothetical protein n=1 Tax=Streptomyces atratus TaxID=1893 RepID=UPI0033D90C97